MLFCQIKLKKELYAPDFTHYESRKVVIVRPVLIEMSGNFDMFLVIISICSR